MIRPDLLILGLTLDDVETSGARIRLSRGGMGPPLLLLHGHPQNHVTWCKVAPRFARDYTVVAPDLRGYGDSGKPPGGADHINYSKRAMARDMIDAMASLGFARFALVGHDRGGRVAHRMALDHPDAVSSIVVVAVAPTATHPAACDTADH